jgi:hypothetical protein
MPLTLTLTDGVLPKGVERTAFQQLCEAMLKWHGLLGNRVMTPNVVGSIHILSREHAFAGLEAHEVAFIEWKVPSFAFATREIHQGYIAEATQILHDLSLGRLPKERIWVNVVHAVDGTWGIAGQALTNSDLATAISQG